MDADRADYRKWFVCTATFLVVAAIGVTAWSSPWRSPQSNLLRSEELLNHADRQRHAGSDECVGTYYQAAVSAWQALEDTSRTQLEPLAKQAALRFYQRSLTGLLQTAQQHHQFDPSRGLIVNLPEQSLVVPTRFIGFSWQPTDFHKVLVVEDYRAKAPKRIHRRSGLGVTAVVVHYEQANDVFLRPENQFAATIVLRPQSGTRRPAPRTNSQVCQTCNGGDHAASLEFYNPNRIVSTQLASQSEPLARDTSAPYVYAIETSPRQGLQRLLPIITQDEETGLFFLEPRRPGHIPVIFVHGLLSAPSTWADLANDLASVPELNQRFQLWGFRYNSSNPFLDSAALLRDECQRAIATLDPAGQDPSLREIVIVGHSMGGLIAKLQVIDGGQPFWRQLANKPLEQINGSPQVIGALRRSIFFHAQPQVSRVVFIGAPHHGSAYASRLCGRIASRTVRPDTRLATEHQLLMEMNPGVFRDEFIERMPTSVDLLEPDSSILATMMSQPVKPWVTTHSIIGDKCLSVEGRSDSVVTVQSARHPHTASELCLPATHTAIHHQEACVRELLRILAEHHASYVQKYPEACQGITQRGSLEPDERRFDHQAQHSAMPPIYAH